jgi:cytochrome c553
LKLSSRSLSAAVTAQLAVAVFSFASAAQTTKTPPPAAKQPAHEHEGIEETPTNLKVLPKDFTGEQVHQIMHKWEAQLGVKCSTCHAADPKLKGPNGRPRLNFADDSKEEKRNARVMYQMTEDINKNYVARIENSGDPVTCGTCHRGHLDPEPFKAPKEEHDHDRPDGPPPAGQKPTQPQ